MNIYTIILDCTLCYKEKSAMAILELLEYLNTLDSDISYMWSLSRNKNYNPKNFTVLQLDGLEDNAVKSLMVKLKSLKNKTPYLECYYEVLNSETKENNKYYVD